LSFDIFENKCHLTRAARLTQKSFIFLYFVFMKGSVVRRERSIRQQNIFIIFYIFEKECRATRAVD